MSIGPAPVLAVLVGCFNAAIFLFARGRLGWQMLGVLLAASLGAWAGDATGGRLGIDPIRIGDFHVISATAVAWVGIVFVVVLSILGPSAGEERL